MPKKTLYNNSNVKISTSKKILEKQDVGVKTLSISMTGPAHWTTCVLLIKTNRYMYKHLWVLKIRASKNAAMYKSSL